MRTKAGLLSYVIAVVFLAFPALSQDLILVGGCSHEEIYVELAKKLDPTLTLEVVRIKDEDCEFNPGLYREGMKYLLTKDPTVVYNGVIILGKPGRQDEKLLNQVAARHLNIVPAGNENGEDACIVRPAGQSIKVGIAVSGKPIARTGKCVSYYLELNGSVCVDMPDGNSWCVGLTSTTGFLSAFKAAQMRKRMGIPAPSLRPAFRFQEAVFGEDQLFAPEVSSLSLTPGRGQGSVVRGTVEGPATQVLLYRGVSCTGRPMRTLVPVGGAFSFETSASLKNVCARVADSPAPPRRTTLE